jgi:cytoskeletal protein RodZ
MGRFANLSRFSRTAGAGNSDHAIPADSTPRIPLSHISKRHLVLKGIGALLVTGLLGVAAVADHGLQNETRRSAQDSAAQLQIIKDKQSTSSTNQAGAAANATGSTDTSPSASSTVPNTTSTTSSGSASNSSGTSVNITVNGQNIPVNPNGYTSKTVTTPDGSASVTVNSNQSNTSQSNGPGFTSTHINSHQSNTNDNLNVETHISSQ